MPNGDGTGPNGQRKGLGNGPLAAGPGGRCICPKCGTVAGHVRGMPCTQMECGNCGTKMVRED